MKIDNFRKEEKNNRVRAAATVSWENCQRAGYDLFFETDHAFTDSLILNPNAFLLACAIPALHYGEKRVFVDATICAELKTNLRVAVDILKEWYEDLRRFPDFAVEARKIETKPEKPGIRQSAFFFSGGIDSFATLYNNRSVYHPEHPMYIKDGILVYGLEQDDPEKFGYVYDSLSRVADAIGINLIPMYSNSYLVFRNEDKENKWRFWEHEFNGAALAAAAHAFINRISRIYIANTWHISYLDPWGSHPLLDPYFSSAYLDVKHDGFTQSRYEKTKLVAQQDIALQHLRVCNRFSLYKENSLNCSKCEKCLRTMIALAALDKLHMTDAFSVKYLSAEYAKKYAVPTNDFQVGIYREMIDPLKKAGRHDLATSIQLNMTAYLKRKKKKQIKRIFYSVGKRMLEIGTVNKFVKRPQEMHDR